MPRTPTGSRSAQAGPAAGPSASTTEAALAALRKAERALRVLGAPETAGAAGALLQAAAALDALAGHDWSALAEELRAQAPAVAAARRAALATGLRAACDAAGRAARVVTTTPLELRIAPLAVVFDDGLTQAELRFGTLAIARCAAEPAALLAAHAEACAGLAARGLEPAALFDALHAVWTQRGGGWQDLASALPALCLGTQTADFARDPVAAHFQPYPRVQLVWDLARMRRARAFTRNGLRLSLAPATGGATRDKDLVLFLEDEEGQGQWHRSFSFAPEAS